VAGAHEVSCGKLEVGVASLRMTFTSADVETNVHLLGVLGSAVIVALDICIQQLIGSLLI
jgi:hypothetical protein